MWEILKQKRNSKILIIGIGNELRGDDGFAPQLIKRLERKVHPAYNLCARVKVDLLDCGDVPENFTGKIIDINPDTLILLDALDFGEKPGEIGLFRPSELKEKGFVSTHGMSLHLFLDYIIGHIKPEVLILGVQPKQLEFGSGLSDEVKEAIDILEKELCSSLAI
ncbi:MAG: hydrogenase 3 maturation endopeptidase HyCI [Candidatus Edwardsbacteria bacterium]